MAGPTQAVGGAVGPGRLAGATTLEARGGPLVLVPVGSLEQHGPHLPLDTDTVIAVAVAEGVAAGVSAGEAAGMVGRSDGGVLVAPPLTYTASGEHQHFAGTSSIGTEALTVVLVELVRSMRTWACRVVLVNAHGGNLMALRAATAQLVDEQHDTGWVACATEEVDAHAGFTETSLMLHLRPESVRLDLAEVGNTAPVGELIADLMAGGVIAVSPNGVLGDPAGATAEHGARVLARMVEDLTAQVAAGVPDAHGRLRAAQVTP